MPKETVRSDDRPLSEGETEWREVTIGWRKDGESVEVMTHVRSIEEGFDEHDGKHGQAVHLDTWHSVNELIRKLKQARDGAWGRPE